MAEVEAWMRREGGSVRSAATGLTSLASTLGEEESSLRSTLQDTATAMGWRGQLEQAGQETGRQTTPVIRSLADAVQAGGTALARLADAMDEYAPVVTRVEADLADLRAHPPTTQMQDTVGTVEVVDYPALRAQEGVLERDLAAAVDPLREADAGCRQVLAGLERDVMALAPPGTPPDWTRSLVPAEAWGHLQRTGVVDTEQEAALAASITQHTTPEELRALLEEVPPERLEAFLSRHPAALAILARDYEPVAGDDDVFAGLLQAAGGGELAIPPDPALVSGIAEYWADLSEGEQQRLRLLYPYVIGNLDGVDLENRALANRMVLRDALEAERRWEAVLDAGPTTAEVHEQMLEQARENWWWNPISEWSFNRTGEFLTGPNGSLITDVGMANPDLELERSRARLALYESLVLEAPLIPHGGTLLPDDQRALLVFDPRGDGRYAEWNGSFDAPKVGIFVPGTTTDMANIDSYNRRMRGIAQGESLDTAMITWMGTDLPDAIATDAVHTSYSTEGGRALTSFVEGLGLGSTQELTLVGHSAGGGIVGAADALGVAADRILHVASAGTGPGIAHVDDYPDTTIGGDPRRIQRFSMTAPGDPIEVAQRAGDLDGWIPGGWGHGYDPDETPGFIRLETGRFTEGPKAGERLSGADAHSHVVQPGTDAFDNIIGVVRDAEAIPYREESSWGWLGRRYTNVYDDDDFAGTPPISLDWMVTIDQLWEPQPMAPGPFGEFPTELPNGIEV